MLNIGTVTRFIISRNEDKHMQDMQTPDITNLKLQKLLYYAQGHYLAEFDSQLFVNEIYKWKHGPVIPEIYNAFRYKFKDKTTDFIDMSCISNDKDYPIANIGKYDKFLTKIMAYYDQYTAWKLSEMTHEENPWKETELNSIITLEKIRLFFNGEKIRRRINNIFFS